MNNADYGLTLQKLICTAYGLRINKWADAQFCMNYNCEYEDELKKVIPNIFKKLKAKPVELLTYTYQETEESYKTSPHNFLLDNGKTLSIRTTKTSDKVAPRVVGQAGFAVLNEYFADVYGKEIGNQQDIRNLMCNHIHEILPVFIDKLFQSDYTILLSRKDLSNPQIIRADEVAEYSFSAEDFTFTKGLDNWTECTTLKYHGESIAEIQTHKERTFKFRFLIAQIPKWFQKVKENNETLGMSAEAAICDYFRLEKPEHFKKRSDANYVRKLMPVVKEAFENIPAAVRHSGSTSGERGKQSKCSYDFLLTGNQTLSLKTNKGKMVCPPEVGQPGTQTCYLYFKQFLKAGAEQITKENFKEMVYAHIEEMIPIYLEHLLDSDWLLWIYESNGGFGYTAITK